MKSFFKKGLAVVLTVVMLFSALAVNSLAAQYVVVSGITKISANTSSTSNQYNSNWQYWSQGASKYANMRSSGCRVVAQSKLLVESGIASSNKATFNPDIYFEWGMNNGVFGSSAAESYGHGVSITRYASAVGASLTYAGKVTLTGNDAADAATAMKYINDGYYVIVASSGHQQYVGRAASLAAGKAIILDSWSSWSQSPYACYDMATGMGGMDMTYTYMLYFSVGGTSSNNPSVTFSFPTDPDYSSKYSIGSTNAVLVNQVTRSGVTSMQTGGMYLYDYNGNYIDHISWDVSKISINPFHIWCDVNGELGQTLVPGTRYRYKFYLVANNKTFYSDSYYFDTQGSYTLTFNPNGGTVDKTTMSCTRGVWLGTLPTPKRNGYVFDGWYTAADGGTQITSSTAYTSTGNMTVYAHWSPAPITSISIAKIPSTTTFYVVDTLDTTGLWLYVNRSDGSFEIIQSGFTCSPTTFSSAGTQTITVTYAGKTTTYDVTVKELEPVVVLFRTAFYVDSELYFDKSYESGEAVITPEPPAKEGYTFVKWSPEVPAYMPEQNMNFTAVFEKNEEPPVVDPPVVDPPVVDPPVIDPPATDRITFAVRTPSTTTISYGDSIILHADIEGELPAGAYIEWTASNGNFEFDALNNGTCKITPSSSGDTTFTATVYDADRKVISSDEQVMTSKAGFFQKIIAFFKSIFGLTKTIPQLYKSMI